MNVLFELGYFLGILRRRSGRVILLAKGDIELPSDIAGVVYFDVTDGFAGIAQRIRAELRNYGFLRSAGA